MSSANCPTNDTLKLLCEGTISPELELEIYAHVDDCTNCQRTLDDLMAATQSSVRMLAHNAPPESETLAQRLDELKSQGRPPKLSGDRLYRDLSPWFEAAQDNENAIGRIDEFELLECIGRGGMGIVFRAHDSKLTRDVALKVMSPSLLADASATGRFLREAQSAARINHANVVTLFAVSEVKELPYIAMEYVKGESLQELLDQQGQLEVGEAVNVAKQITAGLAAAHEAGVVHRDIKPANVLIDSRSGNVKLTDFGLARSLDGTQFTASGFLIGTPEFVAPEQIDSGQPVDHRADLFSLGSVLYRLVTDRTPFASDSTLNTLSRISQTDPQEVRSINEEVPQWLAKLIHWLLSKSPENRPENAQAVCRVLEEQSVHALSIQTGQGRVSPRNESHASVVTPSAARRVWLAAAIGAIAFVCAFGWRAWWGEQPARIGTAEELVELYDRSSENDLSIVLTSNEPYFLEPLFLEGRSLVLRSAEGVEPKLIFEVDDVQTCIEAVNGNLAMSGVTIEMQLSDDVDQDEPDEDEYDDRIALVNCEHGSIELSDCRIVSQDCACIRAEGTSCEIDNCDLQAIGDACLVIDSASEDVLALTNCLLIGEETIYFCYADDLTIDLASNTLIGDVGFNLAEIDSEHNHFVFSTTRNVFDVTAALFNIDHVYTFATDLIEDGHLRWKGAGNLYTGPFIKTSENVPAQTLSGLAKWRELTNSTESASKVASPGYDIDRSALANETTARHLDREDLFFDSDEGYGIQRDGMDP